MPTSSTATSITRNVLIDLEADGSVTAFANQDSWEGIVSIEDTTFTTGDTLLIKIRFKNSKALELSNPDINPLNDGIELTKLTLFPIQPPETEYRASGTYNYVGVDGDLLSNPTSWDISSGGEGYVGPFPRENLTDTSFLYSGIDIEINFDPSSPNEDEFICGSPPCVFNLMEWSSSAENVQIVESVTIDIKPDSDPNSINPRSKGVIPVAVLGSMDFDAMQVDFLTVTFGLDGASPAHDGHVEDNNNDGFVDMVFHFKTQETGIACGDADATLKGETFDGTQFTGVDTVRTVGCNRSTQYTSVKGAGAMSWIFLVGLSVLGLWRRKK